MPTGVLIGYRCSGKTTLGRLVAHRLGMEFVDTDRLVENHAGLSIEEMIPREGWGYFRQMEKAVITELSQRKGLVIATGGGVVLDEGNVEQLRKKGWLVWLRTGAHVIRERMRQQWSQGKIRPSLTGAGSLEEIETILKQRSPLYEKAADLVLDVDTLPIEDATEALIRAYLNHTKG
ncbi:MAG: shikimate kinase [Deltaproteobacteria bacterium]|nr:shikimate kinase [Deltaproteobacteria bacterium]